MGPIDALWHLLNFFAPAFGVGVLTALMAKLLWRRSLRSASLQRLGAWAVAELAHDRDEARRRAAGVERELDELRSTAAFRLRQLLLRGSPGIRGLGVRLGRWLPGLRRA